MRLNDLKKRSNRYFTKLGTISSKTGRRTAEYIAKRSYEALPKRIKQYIDDPEQIIKVTANLVGQSGEQGVNLYKAIRSYAQSSFNRVYSIQKKELWNEFRVMESAVYNHYNTYMYRLGFSASKYWFENVVFSNKGGSVVTATLELPSKAGVSYTALEIVYDYSGVSLQAYMY